MKDNKRVICFRLISARSQNVTGPHRKDRLGARTRIPFDLIRNDFLFERSHTGRPNSAVLGSTRSRGQGRRCERAA